MKLGLYQVTWTSRYAVCHYALTLRCGCVVEMRIGVGLN